LCSDKELNLLKEVHCGEEFDAFDKFGDEEEMG
jgi:hypothetical protein